MENTLENKAKFFAANPEGDIYINDKNRGKLLGVIFDKNPLFMVASEKYPDGIRESLYFHEFNSCFIEKQPLSQITDEDALQIVKCIFGFLEKVKVVQLVNTTQIYIIELSMRIDITTPRIGVSEPNIINIWDLSNDELMQGTYVSDMVDKIRLLGYAYPCMGVTIEQQIEWGWMKLKEQ